MNIYIPEAPLHYALNYIPFNYSIDPDWGLIAFLKTTTEYIQKLKTDSPSFDYNAKRLLIESEESGMTFGVIEIGLEEFIFGMMNNDIFEIITSRLNLTVYRKEGNIGTSLFSVNDFLGTLEGMVRQVLIDQVLAELD